MSGCNEKDDKQRSRIWEVAIKDDKGLPQPNLDIPMPKVKPPKGEETSKDK